MKCFCDYTAIRLTARGPAVVFQNTYCRSIGVEYMFINNYEQCNWIREQFEVPGVTQLKEAEKLLAWQRVLRSTKYVECRNYVQVWDFGQRRRRIARYMAIKAIQTFHPFQGFF